MLKLCVPLGEKSKLEMNEPFCVSLLARESTPDVSGMLLRCSSVEQPLHRVGRHADALERERIGVEQILKVARAAAEPATRTSRTPCRARSGRTRCRSAADW